MIFCSSLRHYVSTLKTKINLPFPVIVPYCVTVLAGHCITRPACLYFREYSQAVACSAQPLLWPSHSSCSTLHGLKVFAEPVNHNGVFFPGGS